MEVRGAQVGGGTGPGKGGVQAPWLTAPKLPPP